MSKAVLSGSFRHGSPPSGEASWPDGAVLRYRGKDSLSSPLPSQRKSKPEIEKGDTMSARIPLLPGICGNFRPPWKTGKFVCN